MQKLSIVSWYSSETLWVREDDSEFSELFYVV